jgi:hypothetical protein
MAWYRRSCPCGSRGTIPSLEPAVLRRILERPRRIVPSFPICGHLRFTSTLDVGRSMFDVSPILIPVLIPLSAFQVSSFIPHPSLRSPLFRFQVSSLILPPLPIRRWMLDVECSTFPPSSPHSSSRSSSRSSLLLLRSSGFKFHPSSFLLFPFDVGCWTLNVRRFPNPHPSSFSPLSAFQVSSFIPHPSLRSPLFRFQVSGFIPHPSSLIPLLHPSPVPLARGS